MNSPSDSSTRPPIRSLTPIEGRVLGVLFEKQHTVPDTYPLSLNSLASGCNQKTARDPVMNVTEADILEAIDSLKRLSLVAEGSSSRVPRFEHNLNRVFGVPSQSAALLATLLLRGPQTAAELRLNIPGRAKGKRPPSRGETPACSGRTRKPLDASVVW
jgi:uncharacterized protein